jgi:hypothetical protein
LLHLRASCRRTSSPRPPPPRIAGQFGYLLPLFKAKTGIDVKAVVQGTGRALDISEGSRQHRPSRLQMVALDYRPLDPATNRRVETAGLLA